MRIDALRCQLIHMPEPSDDLLNRLKQGDASALMAFVELKRPALMAFIERSLGPKLRSRVESEDILQEALLSALRAPQDFAVPGRDPFGLFCQMAEQRIVDAHRRFFGAKKRNADREVSVDQNNPEHSSPLRELLVASLTTPSQALNRGEQQVRLQAALQTLPADTQTALRLRYVDGLPTKDIAHRLGKSDGAIRVLLTRCVSQLQDALRDE